MQTYRFVINAEDSPAHEANAALADNRLAWEHAIGLARALHLADGRLQVIDGANVEVINVPIEVLRKLGAPTKPKVQPITALDEGDLD